MRVVLSWSGGKDSALTLLRLLDDGHDVTLAHLTDAATRRDRAHGVPDFLVEEQAAALALPLDLRASDIPGYGGALAAATRAAKAEAIAFGDIHLEAHRAWGQRFAEKEALRAIWPLWGESTRVVATEAVSSGLRAFVVACRPPLDPSFLGRFLDADLVADVEARGADPAGEDGSYHTLVIDGPRFRRRVDAVAGASRPVGEGWMLDLSLRGC